MRKAIAILLTAVIFASMIPTVSAASEAAVYIRDGGKGDGSSASSPVGSLEDAYGVLFSNSSIENDHDSRGVIVICGTLTVSDHFNYNGKISHKGRVTYTSSYLGKQFDARLLISVASKSSLSVSDEHRFVLGGPTRFENLIIDRGEGSSVSLTIYASTELYVAESVDVINTNWSSSYTEHFPAMSQAETESVILSAHRGFQPMGPENSILAFEAAGALGFDFIETDVIMSADGELVCIHDQTLDRTTNGSGKVRDMTYSEIKKYRIDSSSYGFDLASADKTRLYVPTFREYLEICNKYGSKPFIEIKDSRERVIKKIIDTALEYFAAENIIMSCSDLSALEVSYSYNRDVFHHLIWGVQTDAGYANSIDRLSKMTDSDGNVNAGIAFNIKGLANEENYEKAKNWIDRAHDAGLLACLRGADALTELRFMFKLGIDYYPTNTTSPAMLSQLNQAVSGGYTYSPASGGKLFIRGGRRSEVTTSDVKITLLSGIYDFVAPSNAEAASTGNYAVTVGGNAFVSRLVASETSKSVGERESSLVTVKDDAVINDLFVAGDSANTKHVTVEILGGKLKSISESREKSGTAEDFELILFDNSLMPEKLSISNAEIIKGKRTLMVYGETNLDTEHWDEVILLSISAPVTDQTTDVETIEQESPVTSEQSTPETPTAEITTVMLVAVVLVFIAITTAIVGSKMSSKARKK